MIPFLNLFEARKAQSARVPLSHRLIDWLGLVVAVGGLAAVVWYIVRGIRE